MRSLVSRQTLTRGTLRKPIESWLCNPIQISSLPTKGRNKPITCFPRLALPMKWCPTPAIAMIGTCHDVDSPLEDIPTKPLLERMSRILLSLPVHQVYFGPDPSVLDPPANQEKTHLLITDPFLVLLNLLLSLPVHQVSFGPDLVLLNLPDLCGNGVEKVSLRSGRKVREIIWPPPNLLDLLRTDSGTNLLELLRTDIGGTLRP